MQISTQHKGIRGWLFILCFMLTIFGPLLTIYEFILAYIVAIPYFNDVPFMLKWIIVGSLLDIGLIVWSIYAGISLWKISPNAVKIAKRYLFIFLSYSIFQAFLFPFMVGVSWEVYKVIISRSIWMAIRAIIYFIIGYTYLTKSKRVKATYDTIS